VSLNSWRVYRISRAGSVWGVGIELGGSFYTVAQISYNSSRIYLAHSDTEEGFYEDLDPYITAKFLYFRPQYLKQGSWVDWSLSDINGLSSLSIHPPEKNMRFVRATMALLQLSTMMRDIGSLEQAEKCVIGCCFHLHIHTCQTFAIRMAGLRPFMPAMMEQLHKM
jgi:hypothetical protein